MAKTDFDVTKHVLVPKHEKCTKKEQKEVLERYKAEPSDFPRILITDPAIQHLNPEEGDLIKITRNSLTAGTAIFYRVVVAD